MPSKIEIITQADNELYQAFQRLIPQLTNNNPPPSLNDLSALVRDSSSTLIAARTEDHKLAGFLTLVIYHVPTGVRAIIEDVIVDESLRGQGIGEALMRFAIDLARSKGAGNISLTSNPIRESANKLYLKMGFKKRETNAYQYKFVTTQ